MCGLLAEGSLARKASNYLVTDAASRSCNSLSLPVEQLAVTFDILFNAIWERRVQQYFANHAIRQSIVPRL